MVLDSRTHIVRLLEQQRFAEAEEQLRRLATVSPNDGSLHALHALCLAELEHLPDAVDVARRAVEIAPGEAYCHSALATVRLACHEFRKARVSAARAVRLDPEDPYYLLVLARAEAGQAHWDEALAALQKSLTLNPEHEESRALRARILELRGRTAEAREDFMHALARDPADPIAHAGRGWVTLQEEPATAKAIAHFTDALRHDPACDWAREGLIAALKARNPLYRLMLAYFMWLRAQSRRAQLLFLLAAVLGYNVLRQAAADHPELAPAIGLVAGLYLVFLLLSWLAEPLFDLLLRLDPDGRAALTRERIVASNWVLADMVVVALLGVVAFLTGTTTAAFAALIFGFLLLPLAGTFQCDAGWPRTAMAALTAFIALLGAGVLLVPPEIGPLLFSAAIVTALLSTWVNHWLASVVPARR